jgi:hypothetical protein
MPRIAVGIVALSARGPGTKHNCGMRAKANCGRRDETMMSFAMHDGDSDSTASIVALAASGSSNKFRVQ